MLGNSLGGNCICIRTLGHSFNSFSPILSVSSDLGNRAEGTVLARCIDMQDVHQRFPLFVQWSAATGPAARVGKADELGNRFSPHAISFSQEFTPPSQLAAKSQASRRCIPHTITNALTACLRKLIMKFTFTIGSFLHILAVS